MPANPDNFLAKGVADAQIDEWLRNPPECLLEWGKSQGIEIRYVPKPNWGNLMKKLDRQGMLAAAMCYIEQQAHDLRVKYRLTQHKRAAKPLVHRFLEDRLLRSHRVVQLMGQATKDDLEADLLPAHIRWAVNHPALAIPPELSQDPVCRAFIDAYERKNPAPSQMAVSLFLDAQEDAKARAKLFADVATMMRDERKKVKQGTKMDEDPLVAEAELFEQEIEAMIKGMPGGA